MRYPCAANLVDEETGFSFLDDIEVMIEADIDWDGGEPRLEIGRVYAVCQEPRTMCRRRATELDPFPTARETQVDMIDRGGIWKHLALEIIEQAEQSGVLLDAVLEAEGVVFVGHPNDPDSRFVQVPA